MASDGLKIMRAEGGRALTRVKTYVQENGERGGGELLRMVGRGKVRAGRCDEWCAMG